MLGPMITRHPFYYFWDLFSTPKKPSKSSIKMREIPTACACVPQHKNVARARLLILGPSYDWFDRQLPPASGCAA